MASGPVSQWIADTLARRIAEGAFPGGRLPAERFLCSELGVSRTALRSALTKLEERGVIERVHGRGTFVHRGGPEEPATRSVIALFHGLAPVDLSSYYRGIVDGALWEAADRGLDILFAHLSPEAAPEELRRAIAPVWIKGALMLAFQEDDVRDLPAVGTPLVLVDMPSAELGCAVPDDELGLREAIGFLAGELSHRRISYVLWSTHRAVSEYRLRGYRKAVQEHALDAREELVTEVDNLYSGSIRAAERLMALPQPPTAIVCDSEVIARGVIEGVRGKGRGVPDEVSVMAIGGPGGLGQLAAVTFDVEEIGRAAVREVARQMAMPFSKPRRSVIPPRLVRGSTCSAAP